MASPPIKLLNDSKLLLRIEKHKKLLACIRDALPHPLSEHCLDCCVTDKNSLLIFCENAAWAFNLRFYAEHILSRLLGYGEPINSVQIRLLPPLTSDTTQKTRKEYFNCHTAANTLKALAVSMPQDDLAKSLNKLIETLSST